LLNASELDALTEETGLRARAFLCGSGLSAVHTLWGAFAAAARVRGEPVSVMAGCRWADTSTSATDDTSAIYRAGVLNNQDFVLCAGGLDRLGSYLSLAPAAFGCLIGGGIGHNLTNDALIYGEVEKRWDERASGQITALIRGGVLTYKLGARRWVIASGVNTLQANATAWNTSTNDTSLIMQRDVADFIRYTVLTEFETVIVGADEIDASSIADALHNRVRASLTPLGLVRSYRILSITQSGVNGYDLAWQVRPAPTVDFVDVTTYIQIGEG
jgi:hypothetical protein